MSTAHNDDSEAQLARILDRIQGSDGETDAELARQLDEELDQLSADQLEELVQGQDCLRLLDELSRHGDADPPATSADESGETIGKYRLVRKLGSGGFADVYLATDQRLEREVALKLLHPRYASDIDVVRRFEREGHAAAMLAHPSIIPIYEAGRIDGHTFIAMQYCDGGDLRQWLAGLSLPIPVSVAAGITLAIAEALGQAHSRSVLHRDIKPGNVLLSDPVGDDLELVESKLRVSDFGLVKEASFDPDLTSDGTIEAALGTPAYMSPEQSRGESLSPSSDVFSLGIVLYELLTGENPHRQATRGRTFDAIQNQPTAPPSRLRREINADLDAIVSKCLAKVPEDRYSDGFELAADLTRWLDGKPVMARRVGRAELLQRWCRRHPTVATSLAIAILALTSGAAVATWKWREAVAQRKIAEQASTDAEFARRSAERAAAQSDAMLQTVLATIGALDPSRGGGARVEARELLLQTRQHVEETYPAPSSEKLKLVHAIADACDGLGHHTQSAEFWREAHAIALELDPPDEDAALECLAKRATALERSGDLAGALDVQSEILRQVRDRFGNDSPETLRVLSDLGMMQYDAGWYDASMIPLELRQEFELSESVTGDAAAIAQCEEHVRWVSEHFGDDHPSTFASLQRLAQLYFQSGLRAEAVATIHQAIDLAERHFGVQDQRSIEAQLALAFFTNENTAAKALELVAETETAMDGRFESDHPLSLKLQHAKALCLWYDGRTEEAIEGLRATQLVALGVHGATHPETIAVTAHLASLLTRDDQPDEARTITESAIAALGESVGPRHRGRRALEREWAMSLAALGEFEQSIATHLNHAEAAMAELPVGHPYRTERLKALWQITFASGDFEEAIPWIKRFVEESPSKPSAKRFLVTARASLALSQIRTGAVEAADEELDQIAHLELMRGTPGAIVGSVQAQRMAYDSASDAAMEFMKTAMRRLMRSQSSWNRIQQSHAKLLAQAIVSGYRERGEQEQANRFEQRIKSWTR